MVRSVGDIKLYKCTDDKDKYLELIKKYQNTYLFKVYAYCIMDTHTHIIIDAAGADISKFMHGINQCYAQYYNRKYNRHGHVFQDRFKSKIVSDDRNLIELSAYIHNNPRDIKGYRDKVERYKYSSLGIYLGIMKDLHYILDTDFIIGQFSKDTLESKNLYLKYIYKFDEEVADEDVEFKHERSEYRSGRRVLIRNFTPTQVVSYVEKFTGQSNINVNIKYIKRNIELKSLCALLMRGACDMKQRDICAFMGNITQSHAARLCFKGMDLVESREEYRNMVRNFIEKKVS
jgi:REP element-mobilizing transposase RayT